MQDLFLCIAVLYHVLGNILTHVLPHSSPFSASVRAFMYSSTYLALNEAKIAAAGTTPGLDFWLPFPPSYLFLFQMLVELAEMASSCSQQVTSQTWNRNLNPVVVFLNMAYFKAPFTARLHWNQSSSFYCSLVAALIFMFLQILLCHPAFTVLLWGILLFWPLSSPGYFDKVGLDLLRWITGYYCKRRCCPAWDFTLCPLGCHRFPHPACTIRSPVKLIIWMSQWRSSALASPSTSGCCMVQQC